ncbi:hypothetical protein F9802_00365 [Bacillus aerolatus]|uniref:Bypass-of-forespore C N-terminal domain-containing protein n=1 Tax=Bacillus aerolatus TaxID=2653354 RepID=A0A6I1FMX2_9BACI|nr:BofC N-terminal domain-containing protein [Bacillus aerolatus]KAB7708647.1 hypothetical protein F9802_00365 [Bacillus aerolatus]
MKWVIPFILFLVSTTAGTYLTETSRNKQVEAIEAVDSAKVVSGPHSVQVIIRETDEHGQLKTKAHAETIWAMEDFWAQYEGYQLVDMNEKEVIFETRSRER